MDTTILDLQGSPNSQPPVFKDIGTTAASSSSSGLPAAVVSLDDCLACTGCVTSAETVLITEQSVDELRRQLERGKIVALSISPQSLAALAAFYQVPPVKLLPRISFWLKKIGVTFVFDMAIAEAIHIMECQVEFVRFYKQNYANMGISSPHRNISATIGCSLGGSSSTSAEDSSFSSSFFPSLPFLLSSHCPGWVCYAEKLLSPEFAAHISSVKSSQGLQGVLIKRLLPPLLAAQRWALRTRVPLNPFALSRYLLNRTKHNNTNKEEDDDDKNEADQTGVVSKLLEDISEERLYHVAVMPCFDKKLEAARPDERLPSSTRAVDGVLSTAELLSLLCVAGSEPRDPRKYAEVNSVLWLPYDQWIRKGEAEWIVKMEQRNEQTEGQAIDKKEQQSQNGRYKWLRPLPAFHDSSGGSAEGVLRYAASSLFGCHVFYADPLPVITARTNKDFKELTLNISILTTSVADTKTFSMCSNNSSPSPPTPTPSNSSSGPSVSPLRVWLVYGFRNLQNLVRRCKKADTLLPHYVEVMACPGGCLNGGGQIKENVDKKAEDTLKKEEVGEEGWGRQDSRMKENDVVRQKIDKIASASSGGGLFREQLQKLERLERVQYAFSECGATHIKPAQMKGLMAIYSYFMSYDKKMNNEENGDRTSNIRTCPSSDALRAFLTALCEEQRGEDDKIEKELYEKYVGQVPLFHSSHTSIKHSAGDIGDLKW